MPIDYAALANVLEPYPRPRSLRGLFEPLFLAFYTTELKPVQHLANLLDDIEGGRWEVEHNNKRYFTTLHRLKTVDGTRLAPALTEMGREIVRVRNEGGGAALTAPEKREIERLLLVNLLDLLSEGQAAAVAPAVKRAIRNVQDLSQQLLPEDYAAIVQDDDLAWLMQAMNIEGTEIPRYFRVPAPDRPHVRAQLDALYNHVPPAAGMPANVASYVSVVATDRIQRDIRTRVQDLLAVYAVERVRRGDEMPFLTPDLTVPPRVVLLAPIAAPDQQPRADVAVRPLQLIVSGCPGSGKSHWIDEQLRASGAVVFRAQFHEEFSYPEFVGSFKPRTLYEPTAAPLVDASGNAVAAQRPVIDYAFVPGPFARAIETAYRNPNEPVVVVIEEINRGNAAAAFGELFQALDRADDGYSRYPLTPPEDLRLFLEGCGAMSEAGFRLPPNLSIWASMNGADQGVQPLDTAFRRRWTYRYMGFDTPSAYSREQQRMRYGGQDVEWDVLRGAINDQLIERAIDEDKLIGPYFLTPSEIADSDAVLTKLFLYLWDDVLRFERPKLFRSASFAELKRIWNSGEGEPLTLEMPVPNVEVVAAPAEPPQQG